MSSGPSSGSASCEEINSSNFLKFTYKPEPVAGVSGRFFEKTGNAYFTRKVGLFVDDVEFKSFVSNGCFIISRKVAGFGKFSDKKIPLAFPKKVINNLLLDIGSALPEGEDLDMDWKEFKDTPDLAWVSAKCYLIEESVYPVYVVKDKKNILFDSEAVFGKIPTSQASKHPFASRLI